MPSLRNRSSRSAMSSRRRVFWVAAWQRCPAAHEHFQLARKKLAIRLKPELHNASVGYGNRPHAGEAFKPALVQDESRLSHGSALG